MTMTIEDYITATGHTSGYFAHHADVPHGIIKAIQYERPIAKAQADKVCAYLSAQLGRRVEIKDIEGLKIC